MPCRMTMPHETMAARTDNPADLASSSITGPDGQPMTLADLPPANTRRWVARRKAQVVFAVRAGLISLEEACERYALTFEEFASWQRMIDRHGLRGLRVTRLGQYRRSGNAKVG